jgi:general secretion pathway protein F
MAAYAYKALGNDGSIHKGVLEGDSERHIRSQLRARQLQALDVVAAPQIETAPTALQRKQLDAEQLALLTRQLATLIQAGVPLDDALAAIARHSPDAGITNLLMQLRSRVLEGQSFATALGSWPRAFSRLYQAMVRAGEHAGLLGAVLEQLADYLERRRLLQQKVQMALIYPLVLLLVASAVIVLLMVFVMPSLVGLFNETGTTLPWLTRVLIGMSSVLSHWWWLLLLLLGAGGLGLRQILAGSRRRHWDAWLLRLPVLRGVIVVADTARFASTLSILVQSGVALVDAIGIAAEVMGNACLRARTAQVAVSEGEGGSLARALEQSGVFSPLLLQLVASGEASGQLEQLLAKAAQAQEQELALQLDALVKILEPLIIVVMAVVVGAIVLSVLLPIMQMNSLIV